MDEVDLTDNEFDELVERVRANAEDELQPEVLDIDGSNPHIYLTLDGAVAVSRREFLQKISSTVRTDPREVTLSFMDAANTTLSGVDGVRYRIRVDTVAGNPLA